MKNWIVAFLIGVILASLFWYKRQTHTPNPAVEAKRAEAALALTNTELLLHKNEFTPKNQDAKLYFDAYLGCLEKSPEQLKEIEYSSKGAVAAPEPTPEPTPTPSFEVEVQNPPEDSAVALAKPSGEPFFCPARVSTPSRADPFRWDKLFPFLPGNQPGTLDYGLNNTGVRDEDFLDSRFCERPVFWEMTQKRYERTRIFSRIAGQGFSGDLLIDNKGSEPTVYFAHFHFNENPTSLNPVSGYVPERQYFQILRRKKSRESARPEEIYENRVLAFTETHPALRLNACSKAVTVLNDFCPWKKNYDLEYKDLFFTQGRRRITGNVYCRNAKNQKWERVGRLLLKPSND